MSFFKLSNSAWEILKTIIGCRTIPLEFIVKAINGIAVS